MKLYRGHEDVEDAVRIAWKRRCYGKKQASVELLLCTLTDALRALQFAPPSAEWFAAAHRNFDTDCDGLISFEDVMEIAVQYVNAYLQLNSSRVGGGDRDGAGGGQQNQTTTAITTGSTCTKSSFASAKSEKALSNADGAGDPRPFPAWLHNVCQTSFEAVDAEGIGKIGVNQMKTGIQIIIQLLRNVATPTDKWFQEAFHNFDEDRDDLIDRGAFCEIVQQYLTALVSHHVKVMRKSDGLPMPAAGGTSSYGGGGGSGAPAGGSITGSKPPGAAGGTVEHPRQEAASACSRATPEFDARLCRATKSAILRINGVTDPATEFPAAAKRVNAEQTAELVRLVWKSIPEFGRSPSVRWCKLAFVNFDRRNAGTISLESWCEIVRQYAMQKIGVWPETFTGPNVQNADCSKMPMQEAGWAGAAAASRAGGAEITRGERGGGAGGPVGAIMEQATGGGQPMESVHLAQHVIVPTFSGKAQVMQDYTFMEKKGEGAFGKVMTVKHQRTGVMRACKSITLKNKDQARLVETEVELMKQLDHPNILRLYEVYYEQDTTIYLVTELCNGGSLFDRLVYHSRNLKRPMSERQSARYIQQCLQALSYCHGMGIIHRDVKPDNVLFVTRKADSAVKLIDFGLSEFLAKIEAAAKTVKINKEKEILADGIRRSLGIAIPGVNDPLIRKVMPKAGTPHYMPPEMHHKAWYGVKADVFACGIMLYQMLTGVHPFFIPGKDNADSAKQKIVLCRVDYSMTYWNDISPLAKDLVMRMLAADPRDRVNTHEALQHLWFASAPKVSVEIRGSVVDNLVEFQTHNKLRQAVLRLLAKEVDETAIADLRAQFVAMDGDGDGILQLAEILEAAQKAGINASKTELEAVMFTLHGPQVHEHVDFQIGLNYRDFIGALLERKVAIDRAHLLEIFKRFEDPNDPGFITTASIKESIKAHKRLPGASASRRHINEQDFSDGELKEIMNGSTKINFETFLTVCYKGRITDNQGSGGGGGG